MIAGKTYYFFRLDTIPNDPYPEYRIAESVDDLHLRFGDVYIRQFCSITKLYEVTIEHIHAINTFLLHNIL